MKLLHNTPLPILLVFALAACGGDSGMGPDLGDGNGTGDTRMIQADPSYASVIQNIFDRKGCTASSCHGSSQQAGLNLRSGSSYADLVGVEATQSTSDRVIPGDADGSYLVVKVEGRQTVGARMPLGGSNLDNIDLTNLKNWITQGAKNN